MVTVKTGAVLEIECDVERNRNPIFPPLQRALRGRFVVNRLASPQARIKLDSWPEIPGQRVRLDLESGEACIVEPLREPKQAALREKIERTGKRIAPEREELGVVHLPTYLFWIKRLVESKQAKILRGELPDEIEGEPQISFIHKKQQPTVLDRLLLAFEKNNDVLAKLLASK